MTEAPTTTTACPPGEHKNLAGHCVEPLSLTTTTSTVPTPEVGSKDNPFPISSPLTWGDYDQITFQPLELVSSSLIHKANPYNTPPPAGQTYVRFKVSAVYTGDDTGSGFGLSMNLHLVGDKATIYTSEFLSDYRKIGLAPIDDQPNVIKGGTITGFAYYLIDTDDTNILILVDNYSGNQYIDITP
jgi:hypothetical protein